MTGDELRQQDSGQEKSLDIGDVTLKSGQLGLMFKINNFSSQPSNLAQSMHRENLTTYCLNC